MTLQERMNAMKETFERTLSAEKRDIRHRATEDLRRSGILDRVIKVGAPIPEFTLPNARGEKVSSADLTAGGSYAPVTVLVHERGDDVRLSYDRMASLLAPYGNMDAIAVARDLDSKIESLLQSVILNPRRD